jgi:hypothetical protein
MSGYKRATVKISEEEYRRLQQADRERRSREHAKKTDASRQAGELTNSLRDMENRQRQLEQALGALGADFDWMGAEIMQDVFAQNSMYYESLATIIEEINADTNTSLFILSQRFEEAMEREREQYRQHLQSLSQRLNAYEQREQSKAEVARQWLRQSVAFADFIQKQFDHERFLPGRLSRLLGSLNFAQSNLAQGFYESSLQTSQQAFLGLSELHAELEQRTLEWQSEYARAKGALTQFVSELEMSSTVSAFGLEGEELPEQVDLTFWSNRKYHELLDKSRKLLAILSQEQRSISTEELRQTYSKLLPVLADKFESIIYEARLNALNSQLRMNIAERALQALELQGFQLNSAGYSNQDMRTSFSAHLKNPDGSQVMIEVLPAETSSQELTNELVVITNHPYLKTEHEARLQWQELCRSLHQYDLHVSRPEIRSAPLPAAESVEHPAVLTERLPRAERRSNV